MAHGCSPWDPPPAGGWVNITRCRAPSAYGLCSSKAILSKHNQTHGPWRTVVAPGDPPPCRRVGKHNRTHGHLAGTKHCPQKVVTTSGAIGCPPNVYNACKKTFRDGSTTRPEKHSSIGPAKSNIRTHDCGGLVCHTTNCACKYGDRLNG